MAEDGSSQYVDPRLVAEIVRSYVVKNSVAVKQLGGLIATVHQTLSGLGTNTTAPTLAPEKSAPAVPIRRSVQPNHVVCLECGFRALPCAGICGPHTGSTRRPTVSAGSSRRITR